MGFNWFNRWSEASLTSFSAQKSLAEEPMVDKLMTGACLT